MSSNYKMFLFGDPKCLDKVKEFLDTLGPSRIISVTGTDAGFVVWFWKPL